MTEQRPITTTTKMTLSGGGRITIMTTYHYGGRNPTMPNPQVVVTAEHGAALFGTVESVTAWEKI